MSDDFELTAFAGAVLQGLSEGLFICVAAVIGLTFAALVVINVCDIVDYSQGRMPLDELSGAAQAFVTTFLDPP